MSRATPPLPVKPAWPSPSAWTLEDYERDAREYCASLPLEHFMEGEPQATQREITLESLALLKARRDDVQVFNELLIQYVFEGVVRRVVPDNMVRICRNPLKSQGSFIVKLETVQPLLVAEWVSSDKKKDYQDSFAKYEQELKIPYCLTYHPDNVDLRVWHHSGQAYARVPANAHGRHAVPDLDLEVALLDGWVRYWYQGELLPLPADYQRQLEQADQRANQADQRANQAAQRANQADQRANQAAQRANQADQRANQADQRADQERARADQAVQRATEASQLHQAAESEMARLKALLEQSQANKPPKRRPRKGK